MSARLHRHVPGCLFIREKSEVSGEGCEDSRVAVGVPATMRAGSGDGPESSYYRHGYRL